MFTFPKEYIMFFVFCIFILPIAVLVILLLSTRQKTGNETSEAESLEECALCHQDFSMKEMVEKEIGDYGKIYCFCGDCIEKLYQEFKNQISLQTGE